ncbi:helix-turn-helix domain-containing protein [Glutamicibacter sp. MNS18]|uniref:helix-turn-helix domain-containing protein n=1 Tax=Glutamicibacter sp. MNS18 TaxID=2989817 RepID=UPI0022362587|nr:helix-turn-helix domain-containing protein [Glutamicibacter sp. MNS18]MCW4465894.1 helix-turn-helix domain-containing protein [Glutamicibacter sp. MNS18]
MPPQPQPVEVFWKCNLGYYIVVWVYQGVTRVHFEDEVVSLHVGQAVWIPPRLAHRVEHDGTSVALAILIPDRGSHSLGGHRVFINVPPSHTQWMFHLMLLTLSPLHTGQLPTSRIVDLLAHFATGEPPGRPAAELLLPHHPAARQVAAMVLADPVHAPPLVESARRLQVSERTLRRAFAEQTGMGFRQWTAAARQAVQLRGQTMPAMPVPALTTRWMNFLDEDIILWAMRGRATVQLLAHAASGRDPREHRLQAGQFLLVPHGHSVRLDIESGSMLFPLRVDAGYLELGGRDTMPCQLPADHGPIMLHRAINHITLLRPTEFDRRDTLRMLEKVPDYPGLGYPRTRALRRVADELAEDLRGRLSAAEVAQRHGFSLRQLQRLWPLETGLSLRRWRQAHRMQRADALLGAGFGIARTAAQLGFTTPGNFSRAYTRVRGYRPKPHPPTGQSGHFLIF